MRKILLGTALALASVTYAQAQQQTGTTITPENVLELVDANGNGTNHVRRGEGSTSVATRDE